MKIMVVGGGVARKRCSVLFHCFGSYALEFADGKLQTYKCATANLWAHLFEKIKKKG